MGGGKSRAICEKALEYAMTCPGIQILICRQRHTSIVETTRKTMLDEVLHPAMVAHSKMSAGEDFIDLYTPQEGVLSRINFIGLEDPDRWFSAQIGVLIIDQVEECEEQTVIKLITRLRDPRAPKGSYTGRYTVFRDGKFHLEDVVDYPLYGKVILSFNPRSPDHWLRDWFYLGNTESTPYGFRKAELYPKDAEAPIGDAEFFRALPTDNPHLSAGYLGILSGMPARSRRRYLEGHWEHETGACFFDLDALDFYEQQARDRPPVVTGKLIGDPGKDAVQRTGGKRSDDPIKVKAGHGPLAVWKRPVKAERLAPAHRYVIGCDASSGGSADYSAMQVVDVDAFELVARYQAKVPPEILAEDAYRLGRIYNNAMIVPEVTGGWGFAVDQHLKAWKYPNPYTKRILDRLTKKWTDRTGFDTTRKTKARILSCLEEVIREQEFGLYDTATVSELSSFATLDEDKGTLGAQSGSHDDLVLALAIAVTIGLEQPKKLMRPPEPEHVPQFAVTGW
jgi:hypothetical protein